MTTLSRRDFARFLALTGSASLLPDRAIAMRARAVEEWGLTSAPLPPVPSEPDEKFWGDVRARFLVPRNVAFLNAANLCPASLPAIEAMEKNHRTYEVNPSPEVRSTLMANREVARKLMAEALRVTPEEIVLTRNTTEGNNFISSGLSLGPGDEVIVSADNHPSNLRAWTEKAKRYGFTVVTVPTPAAHPGTEGYVELFTKAFTAKTKVLAVTHVSSNSGDLIPAAELSKAAQERGILFHLDGAQSWGVLDVDLSVIKPAFYTGSMHKWPCGPKEKGVFFIRQDVQEKVTPVFYGVYGGQVGASRRFETEGQRDDASIAAVVEGLKFQGSIGRAVIEKRARALAQHLIVELKKLPGVTVYTDAEPSRSAAIVVFKPAALDPSKLGHALSEKDQVVVTTRGGQDKPGLRIAAHFYNTMEDVDRTVHSIKRYIANGV